MEEFISSIVFVLPGFMLYFWIQMMGVNPVVKHTVIEFATLAALSWIPVTVGSLAAMSLYGEGIWELSELNNKANDIRFIAEFLGISCIVSFLLGVIYVKIFYSLQLWLINKVRVSLNKAKLSKSPSVWEEVFFNNDVKIIGLAKFGTVIPDIVGNVHKLSRPFEPKRAFKLIYVDYVELLINKYEIPVIEVYSDIDSGVNVLIYDYDAYKAADEKERKEPIYVQTPSRSSTF